MVRLEDGKEDPSPCGTGTKDTAIAAGEVERSAPAPLVDLRQMAAMLGVSTDTVRRMAVAREIPCAKIGRVWRFDADEVIAHLKRPQDPWAQSSQSRSRKRRP
jgi:excisionase family DNA binding protein